MYKAIFIGVSAALLLGACTSATGPRFNAYVVSDNAGAKSYKVECHGLFEGAGVCRDKAQEICGDQKVHVLQGVGPLRHDDDVRTLVFQCGEPEQPVAPQPVSVPAPVAAAPASIRLSADAMFAFDRADEASMTPQGRQKLSQLASALKDQHVSAVSIVGYTDRLGGSDHNQKLSEARAKTVGDYLAAAGVPASDIHTEGRGASDPLVECRQGDRKALIACLAPNRRVEVSVIGASGA
ncbi:OmpA family protein [Burkholderia oklahomensis]|uniref:OmpA family protein n=1 Tax=Burkholderia oklahomensis TaxID=342113 RepID=UPI00264A5BB3|nr:OmpA family protein [Burkholderia oklahomensis]MDN7671096.1 OmpA family protein [Burkholderia oklahomensis]